MSVTYSVAATIFRSTNFDRKEFRKVGLTSGLATNEFSFSLDMSTSPLPTFPITVPISNMEVVQFLLVQVTGGTVTLRITTGADHIDLNVEGSMILSGVNISGLAVQGTPTNGCYLEVVGMG